MKYPVCLGQIVPRDIDCNECRNGQYRKDCLYFTELRPVRPEMEDEFEIDELLLKIKAHLVEGQT